MASLNMTDACLDDHLVVHRNCPRSEGWNKAVNVPLHVCQTDGIRDWDEGAIMWQQDIIATYRMADNCLFVIVVVIAECAIRSDLRVRLEGESAIIKD